MSQQVEAGAQVKQTIHSLERRDAWPLSRTDEFNTNQESLPGLATLSFSHHHAASDAAPLLSGVTVVVPVYNSEQTLDELVSQLAQVLPACGEHYELILVNDGSRDGSWQVIRRMAMRYGWLRGINMMRNFGQHNAILCGLRAASCDTIVTMDDDLQHPPTEIPKLLAKLNEEGHDVVYGMPQGLPHSWWRNFTSSFTKQAFSLATGNHNIKAINAFRAFRTHLRQAFVDFRSPQLQIDVLLSWGTAKFATTPVRQEPRKVGRSNYTFMKLFNHTLSMLTGYSTAPLRLASLVGFAFTFVGLLVLLYAVGRALIGEHVPGFPFLASLVSIFSGIQLFILGIIGEYLARVFNRCSERPPYVMSETIDGRPACSSDSASAAA